MKKLWILSILALAMACLFAVGAGAVEYKADITETGLAISSTDRSSAGTYKAGDGTVTVSFDETDGVVCYVTVDNATIDLSSKRGYAIYSPYPTILTITGSNTFLGVDAIKVESGSITLENSDVTGGAFIADSITLNGSSTLDVVILQYDEDNLTLSSGSTVSGLLAARHSLGDGGFNNTVKCVGDVENAEGEVIEVALMSISEFTFEDGATLTLDGTLRNSYSDIDPEEMQEWFASVSDHLSGSGLIQIGIDSPDYYKADGTQLNGTLTLSDENESGSQWSWNASTKTLTLEDGFRCMGEVEFKVSGYITVIVEGDAYVNEDFETDGEGIDATVTITGSGTLTVHDEFEMANDSQLSLVIAEDATVITDEEVELYSLTVNGHFEVNDSSSPLIDLQGGTLTVGRNGTLCVDNTNPGTDDVAIRFSGVTSPDGLCNIAGTKLIPAGQGVYVLADENGDALKDIQIGVNDQPDEDARKGSPAVGVFLIFILWQREMQEYTVTLTASEGGSITGDAVVRWSRDAVYEITPDEGWELAALYLDGEEIEPTQMLELDRVKADHAIEAVFAQAEE